MKTKEANNMKVHQSKCSHKFKAKKVANPMIYECLKCGLIAYSKKETKNKK